MRASGPTTTTTMLGRKESNLQPSASEAAALPVAPLPNAPSPVKGGRSTVELRPKNDVMDGVRIELTVLESGGVTARWTSIGRIPSLCATSSSLRRARRSPLLFALSENDEEEREAGIEPASPGRRPGAQPMGDTRVCAGPQMRRGRGAFATRPREGLRGGERSGSGWRARAKGTRLALRTLEAAIDDPVDAARRVRRRERFGAPLRAERN
jgi:hypothetical protein